MFHAVYANTKFNKSFIYLKATITEKSGGKTVTDYSHRISDIPLTFVPETHRRVPTTDGTKSGGTAKAVIPEKFFTDNSIFPSTYDRLENADSGLQYRIIAIDDYTQKAHTGVYYLHLRRDEYSAVRT